MSTGFIGLVVDCFKHRIADLIDTTDALNGCELNAARFGLVLVEANQWRGFIVVDRQAVSDGLFGVIFALYQVLTADIILALSFRWVVDDVIDAP